ncbi:MAG: hypothetical protein N0E48_23605 [Candidatus Thiodiazotropha endolucinida]|nr:hypothetical protein [Candidatus Thiodiazotropha taylori]MCW4346317.1 hypothetical protein [Candidatus Thiodiazotropha endolucinida]
MTKIQRVSLAWDFEWVASKLNLALHTCPVPGADHVILAEKKYLSPFPTAFRFDQCLEMNLQSSLSNYLQNQYFATPDSLPVDWSSPLNVDQVKDLGLLVDFALEG